MPGRPAFLLRIRQWIDSYGLWAILLMALLLRLAAGVALGFGTSPDDQAMGADAPNYEEAAQSLAAGKGYLMYGEPSAVRAPGYPMLLALLYRLFGHHFELNPLLNILLGLVTVYLTWRCALALGQTRPLACLAALIVACSPLQLYMTHKFMSESAATTLVTLTALLLVLAAKAYRQERLKRAIMLMLGAGLASGYSVLTRPNALLLLPAYGGVIGLLALWQLWRDRRKGADGGTAPRVAPFNLVLTVALTLLLAVGTFAVVAPWTYRNYWVFERFVLVSTIGGMTFWGSNNASVADPGYAYWGSWMWSAVPEAERQQIIDLPEPERDKAAYANGKAFLRHHPDIWLPLFTGKIYRLISPFPITRNRGYAIFIGLAALPLQVFGVIGLIMILRHPRRLRDYAPILAFLLVVLGTTFLFYSCPRFRMPTDPLQAIVCTLAVGVIGKRLGAPLLEDAEDESLIE